MSNHRTFGITLVGLSLLLLAGCVTKPLRPVRADGTYCHKVGKSYRPTLTCTTEAVPSSEVEAQAKRFEPSAGALTVYVLRKRRGDASNLVPALIDGRRQVTTIPESLVRIRLWPGEHRLAFSWEGSSSDFVLTGAAGEVRIVELVGSVWYWGSTYRWEAGELNAARDRAIASKLIADVDLRF